MIIPSFRISVCVISISFYNLSIWTKIINKKFSFYAISNCVKLNTLKLNALDFNQDIKLGGNYLPANKRQHFERGITFRKGLRGENHNSTSPMRHLVKMNTRRFES